MTLPDFEGRGGGGAQRVPTGPGCIPRQSLEFSRNGYAINVILESVLPRWPLDEALGLLPSLGGPFFDPVLAEPYGKRQGADADHYGVMTMISNYLHYQFALLLLLLKRDIDLATWRYAFWKRPIVVCGHSGAWLVDFFPEATESTMRRRALVQFILGMLLIAGAVGWLEVTIDGAGFAALVTMAALKAMGVVVVGLVLAVDATAAGLNRCSSLPCPGRKVCQKPLGAIKPGESSCC